MRVRRNCTHTIMQSIMHFINTFENEMTIRVFSDSAAGQTVRHPASLNRGAGNVTLEAPPINCNRRQLKILPFFKKITNKA